MGLFSRKPKWQHEDPNVRIKAINKLNIHPNKLNLKKLEPFRYVIENDPDSRVRRSANLKLAQIVCHNPDVNIYEPAFEIIDDDVALFQVAVTGPAELRENAISRIKDESILYEMVTNRKYELYPYMYDAIAERSNDDNCLIALLITLKGSDYPQFCDIRQKAIKKITDVSVLEDFAENDVNESVRLEAAKRLNNIRSINESKKEITTKDQLLDVCVDELVTLYKQNPDGFLIDSAGARPVRDVGKKLNEAGGFDLMLQAHQMFSARVNILGAARNLEMVWDGIGSWKG